MLTVLRAAELDTIVFHLHRLDVFSNDTEDVMSLKLLHGTFCTFFRSPRSKNEDPLLGQRRGRLDAISSPTSRNILAL